MAETEEGRALGDLVKAESMIQLAMALPAGCLIGWLLGAGWTSTFHQGWMAIAGILLGAVAGLCRSSRRLRGI